MIFEKI